MRLQSKTIRKINKTWRTITSRNVCVPVSIMPGQLAIRSAIEAI